MQLEEFFANLSYGVLSNLAIGGDGKGVIPTPQLPKLVGYTNKSLLALYTRFMLVEKEVLIRLDPAITSYLLERRYADTDLSPGVKYIEDSVTEPFLQDVLKIVQIYDQDLVDVPMNDPGNLASVFTPDHRALLVRDPVAGNTLSVMYQARHTKLLAAAPVGIMQMIELPEVLHTALESHIGYQVFSGMNGPEATGKAAELLGRYDALCLEVEVRDLVTTSLIQTHTKLEDRGFA